MRFQPDDRSSDWRRRAMEEPGFVGHPPDTGWFCASHIDAPLGKAAHALAFDDGLVAIRERARSRDPCHRRTVAPRRSDRGDPTCRTWSLILVGAELGSARLMASEAFDLRWVEWTLPVTDAHVLAASLRSLVPALFEALGIGSAPALERRTDRRWSPMDGAVPPWCPFTDSTFDEGVAADGTPVRVQVVLEHWNEDDVANATVSMSIGDLVSISVHGSDRGGRDVDNLAL
ncbi:MAG: hypothetical protein R2713_15005 [Ilumatobacteraceae bacterium]